MPALFKSGQWHFHQYNAPVHNSILVTDYLTKMGIKTVPSPSYSSELSPCAFWLFPKLRGCRNERIEEMKEAVTKVIDTLRQEDFHGTFQKLLERYNKCIEAGEDYFEGDLRFMRVISIKMPTRKKSGNLFNDPRIYCHPQTDCFVVSQLFSVARHGGRLKLESKPARLYVRLSIRPLGQQAYRVS